MKDWSNKTDNDKTIEHGANTASDFNSLFRELKNVVKPFMKLDETDNEQLVKSIDILAKHMFYLDIGTPNNVVLKRVIGITEEYRTGTTILFKPKFTNTGITKISFEGLTLKECVVNGNHLESGYLNPQYVYMGVYNYANDKFEIRPISITESQDESSRTFKADDGVSPKDAVNVEQVNSYIQQNDIVDNLTTTSTTKALSANQGRILKRYADAIHTLLHTNDVKLDTIQEIVNYIKTNHQWVGSFEVFNVGGLEDILLHKSSPNHNHDDMYNLKSEVDTLISSRASAHGDETKTFKVANAVGYSDAVNRGQVLAHIGGSEQFDYTETTDPLVTTNPSEIGKVWLNTTTDELFVCTNKTVNSNKWVGTNGTVVQIVVHTIIDIFNDNSCLAQYPFDVDFSDRDGHYDAIPENGVTITTDESIYGKGSADFSVSSNKDIKTDTGSELTKTISLWVKHSGISSTDTYIADARGTSDTSGYFIINNASNYQSNAVTVYADGVIKAKGDAYVADSEWHHYVIIFDTPVNKITLGNYSGGPATEHSLIGWMDNVRYFNRTLTSAEITTLGLERNVCFDVDFFKDNSGIALYEFDNNFKDTGNRFDAVPRETFPLSTTVSKYGLGSLSVPSDSRHVDIDVNILSIRTISMWCNSVPNSHDFVYFWHSLDGTSAIYYNDSRHEYNIQNVVMYRDGVEITNGQAVIQDDGVWHHYVFIIDTSINTSSITIGNNAEATNDTKCSGIGFYDQVRLFDRALTVDEIKLLRTEITNNPADFFKDNSGIALYEFEGNFKDTGNRFDAVPRETFPLSTTVSKYGLGSLSVPSDSRHVDIDTSPVMVKTVSMWVNQVPNNTHSFLYFFHMPNSPYCAYYNDDRHKYIVSHLTLYVDGVLTANDAPVLYDEGNWHHYVFIVDDGLEGAKLTLANDSVAQQETTRSGIGFYDQVRLFDRALTVDEIKLLSTEIPTNSKVDIFKDTSGIAFYQFDGNFDDVNNLHDAIPIGNTTTTTAHLVGIGSADFISDSVIKGATITMGNIKVVSFWFRVMAISSTFNTFVSYKSDNTAVNHRHFMLSNKCTKYAINKCTVTVDGLDVVNTDTFVNDNEWHHAIVTFDTLIDGFTIGNIFKDNGVAYNGNCYIDQMRVFNRDLTESESDVLNNVYKHVNPVDIFGDKSALTLFEFEGNLHDTAGGVDAVPLDNATVSSDEYKYGSQSLDILSGAKGINVDISADTVKSISVWIKHNGITPSTYPYIFDARRTSDTGGYLTLSHADNEDDYNYDFANCTLNIDGVIKANGDAYTPDSEWHHYVIIFDTPVNKITLGNYSGGLSSKYVLNGWIDQLRYFNRTLTADEVEILRLEIIYSPTVDALGDGSAVGLLPFHTGLSDDGGTLTASTIDDTGITDSEINFGAGSLDTVSDSVIKGVNVDAGSVTVRTVTLWAKIDHLSTAYNTFVSYNPTPSDSSNHKAFLINVANGNIQSMLCTVTIDGKTVVEHDVTPAPIDGKWHHYAVVFNENIQTFTIGNIQDDNKIGFNGNCYVDQFRAFNKALTPMEIKAISREQ